VGEFTNNGGATTGDITRWTSSPGKSCKPVRTSIDRVHSKHLLIATNRGGVGAHTKTWTDKLFLDRRQVVHFTLVIHAVSHVQDFLTTTSLLHRDVTKVLHLPLLWDTEWYLEIVILYFYRSFGYWFFNLFGRRWNGLSTQIPPRKYKTGNGHE
jgi:hypothetical protein